MSAFTKGPWKLGQRGKYKQHIDAIDGWRKLARVWVRMNGDDQDCADGMANARLIAAAPEMHEELSLIGVGTTIATEHFNRIQRLLDRIAGIES